MTPHDFTIWLQGYFAALGDEKPMPKDWRIITSKLAEVSTSVPAAVITYPPGVR